MSFRCPNCNREYSVMPKFCGACGTPFLQSKPVTPPAPSFRCTNPACGREYLVKPKFCGSCGTIFDQPKAPNPLPPMPTVPSASHIPPVSPTSSARPVPRTPTAPSARPSSDPKEISKQRTKQFLFLALIVGLCLVFSGIAGNITLSGVSAQLKDEIDLGDFSGYAAKEMTKITIAVIKNDSSGLVNIMNRIIDTAAKIEGDEYGLSALFKELAEPMVS